MENLKIHPFVKQNSRNKESNETYHIDYFKGNILTKSNIKSIIELLTVPRQWCQKWLALQVTTNYLEDTLGTIYASTILLTSNEVIVF